MLSVTSATNSAKRPDLPALTPRTASEDAAASKAAVAPPSPRPTSVEGLDQWFKELQNYETTLGAMATASSDPKFKEELGTIEQWFKLLSDSEQSATLYTLLQNGKPEQVRFIGAVVNQLTAETANAQQQQQVINPAVESAKTKHRPSSLNLPAFAAPAPAPKVNPPVEQAAPAQDVTATSTWASEVNTPMFRMFPTGDKGAATAAQQKLPNSGVVPGLAPGVGIPMLNPFNMAMLNNLGFSNEAQLLAVQMVMSGLVQPPPPPVQKPASTPKSKAPTGNWRGPGSAKYPGSALRSGFKSSGLRSSGLKSSGLKSSGLQSGGLTPLASAGVTPKEAEDIDPEMLKDIPAWMKSLRLHKYNSCFEGMTWEELVVLDDAELEAKGVAALGARRRLTKTFELVKKKMGMEATPTVGDYVLASAALPHKGSSLSHELTNELIVPHSAAPTFSTAA